MRSPAVSRSGIIAFSGSDGAIWLAEPGSAARPVFRGPNANHPCWSPDSAKLAFSSYSFNQEEDSDIWVLDLASHIAQPLIGGERMQTHPAYSPDGKLVAYTHSYATEAGKVVQEVWVADVDGSNRRAVVADGHCNFQPAWSPDSKRIAFASDRTGALEIWTSDLSGQQVTQLTTIACYAADPTWSPDGRELAFVSTKSGSLQIWVIGRDGSGLRQVTQGDAPCKDPFWATLEVIDGQD